MSADADKLAAHYRRLLRVYPRDYRRQRGEEIVGTYLELAGARRRWPSPRDAADLVAGSMRQRLRAAGPGLAGGLHLAGVFALVAASALAAYWLSFVELTGPQWVPISHTVGPFRSLGGFVWLAWLAAAVVTAASPGRRSRRAVAGALMTSVVVVLIAPLTPYGRPALMALLPQFALGLLSLGISGRAARPARFAPLAAAAVTTAAAHLFYRPYAPGTFNYGVELGYRFWARDLTPTVGLLLGLAGLLAAVTLGIRRRVDGLWTALILLVPVALCFVEPGARRISGNGPWQPAEFDDLAIATVGLTLAAITAAVGLSTLARRLRS